MKVDESECDQKCAGDKSVNCGGASTASSVYEIPARGYSEVNGSCTDVETDVAKGYVSTVKENGRCTTKRYLGSSISLNECRTAML